MTVKPHWPNPWHDKIVYVPIEELGALVSPMAVGMWRSFGDKLDAYVFRKPSIHASYGVRYGAEGNEYLSPGARVADADLLALVEKYSDR
jgi:hypothetical protein